MVATDSDYLELAEAFRVVSTLNKILGDLGTPIMPQSRILDFGCGQGKIVVAYRLLGYQAFGTDIQCKFDEAEKFLKKQNIFDSREQPFRQIRISNYSIPFESDFFDFVISTSVFEHVQNFPETLSEIKRVMKPGAKSLNLFPSKYCIFERHTLVPLAGIFRSYLYLLFWALIGIRNSFQEDLNSRECALNNFNYLKKSTNYLTEKQLFQLLYSHFLKIKFADLYIWKFGHGRGHYLWNLFTRYKIGFALERVCSLLSIFGMRAVLLEK